MSTQTTSTLRLSRIINATRDEVFEAWTNPELMMKWSAPEGATIPSVTADLTVGGDFKIHMSEESGDHVAYGSYREIDRPNRLVYTWDWENPDNHMGGTLITVEFNAVGDSTEVIMIHELFPTDEVMEAHNQGWVSCLNRLEAIFG
jgi:uncharacterized protein YndB with AHSA1/START domain